MQPSLFTQAHACAQAVRAGRVSAVEVTRAALDRAREVERGTHAYLQVLDESAVAQAARVDASVVRGEHLPLAGVPVAVKDNLCTGADLAAPGDGLGPGGRTTCASRMLERYESPFTATAVRRLLEAGAVVIAKTNLDEFAMGSSTEHSAFGPARNPWDTARVPGGSSGGSAVSVAARVTPLALGSDTGGSVRQPAAMCGVVGVKPTYGRISRYGLVAYASSLDQVGVFATGVADAALALEVLCGADPLDSTSASHEHHALGSDFGARLEEPVAGLRLGVPRQARGAANHPGVAAAFEDALRTFRSLGAEVVEVDLPMTDAGIAAYYIVALAEASSNLARYDGVRYGRRADAGAGEGLFGLYARSRSEGFGREVKRRIMLGTHVLSSGYYDAYYTTALRARRAILEGFQGAFVGAGAGRGCDAVIMPTAPGPAFRLGEKTSDPLAMYLEDVYTVGVNLAGLPAVSIPAGFVHEGGSDLPVGLQLVAPAFGEARMLRIARMFEGATSFHTRAPSLRQ
ncbi:MAG: Asp-tRNA(Asn)/Glu-tRNA(Gln) amidotransferase subunit GatA [Phycisphaerales bacterium]